MKDRIINEKKLIPKIPDVKQVILKGNGEKPPIRIIMYPISKILKGKILSKLKREIQIKKLTILILNILTKSISMIMTWIVSFMDMIKTLKI